MEAVHHLNVSKLWTQNLDEIYARSNVPLDNNKNIRTKQLDNTMDPLSLANVSSIMTPVLKQKQNFIPC
eukprot:2274374-Ditylum_brightwellii.AAC.1